MGQNDSISRRDFINGMLIAAGGTLLGGCTHHLLRSSSEIGTPREGNSTKDINFNPLALRGGNLQSAFAIAHWMRDERLSFEHNSVRIAASSLDSTQGTFQIEEDDTDPDVIIVGSGISGLASAFYLSQQNPKVRILLLDANQTYGGNAGCDESPPIPVPSSTGAAYAVAPYADFLKEIYREIKVDWESHIVQPPFYNYYFDEKTPFILPNRRGWAKDVYGKGLKDLPYPPEILRDLEKAREDFIRWYNISGGPTDPPEMSSPKYDYLDQMSFEDYLLKNRGYHPALADFFTRFTIDALAGTCAQVSVHSAISFLGAEYHPLFALPGGNAGIARALLNWLIPTSNGINPGLSSVNLDLDHPNQRVRLRQNSVVVRADESSRSASVIYYHQQKFRSVKAKSVIFASLAHTAQHAVQHKVSSSRQQAWRETTLVPVVVANVTLRNADALVDLGLGYNQYWWGSKYWADFVTSDWISPNRNTRSRETVLTFYGGNTAPPEQMPAERMRLMTTPFSEYERSLREDLSRIFQGTRFDFNRDVTAIYIYRWGHGMVYPKPNFLFRPHGKTSGHHRFSARHQAREPIGRISFAGQDTEGTPSIESAIGSGFRAAGEAIKHLA